MNRRKRLQYAILGLIRITSYSIPLNYTIQYAKVLHIAKISHFFNLHYAITLGQALCACPRLLYHDKKASRKRYERRNTKDLKNIHQYPGIVKSNQHNHNTASQKIKGYPRPWTSLQVKKSHKNSQSILYSTPSFKQSFITHSNYIDWIKFDKGPNFPVNNNLFLSYQPDIIASSLSLIQLYTCR